MQTIRKRKKFLIFLVLLFLPLLGVACDLWTKKQVTVVLDLPQTEIMAGKMFTAELKSLPAESIFWRSTGLPAESFWYIEKYDNNQKAWEKLKVTCLYPAGAYLSCNGEQYPFWEPGLVRCQALPLPQEIKWNLQSCELSEKKCPLGSVVGAHQAISSEVVQPGRYRVVVSYYLENNCSGEPQTISQEFEIVKNY